ncbi:hypothetical protein [Corallococcus carmarthensis]|uniref:Lipoprotein n=1 Tax=Corallococcus carmarthensis TaxID=2316728 RepID=A0A3A8KZT7_9BACT|nr:hypothetical protein [Corallococcus carmarthensis]NOK15884.1 hypothetical protein [Corallococcus carmarthensis]RKH07504.1 hypothetical protein D7X32_01710 [Corallococcus carmarthensis]
MKALLQTGGLLLLAMASLACVGPEDKPSNVHDLRVLGVSTEQPELIASTCERTPEALDELAAEVTYRALLVDPAGEGRPIQYTLWACADPDDRTCENEADRALLAEGTTVAGELTLPIRPGAARGAEDRLLLERVLEEDAYQGLGGIRMPLVLRVVAGGEEVYAQKLMVFWCPVVEGMKANEQPVLPGLRVDDVPWPEGEPLELSGPGPFVVTADDVSDREENYVVPGLRLQAVNLKEAWEIAWYSTLGEFSLSETGGADFGGQQGRHRVEWEPAEGATAQDVTFWAVVRDGRGGSSWLVRRARWSP